MMSAAKIQQQAKLFRNYFSKNCKNVLARRAVISQGESRYSSPFFWYTFMVRYPPFCITTIDLRRCFSRSTELKF